MNRYLVLVPRLVLLAVVTVVDVLGLFAWLVGSPLAVIPLLFTSQAGLVGLIRSQGTRRRYWVGFAIGSVTAAVASFVVLYVALGPQKLSPLLFRTGKFLGTDQIVYIRLVFDALLLVPQLLTAHLGGLLAQRVARQSRIARCNARPEDGSAGVAAGGLKRDSGPSVSA
jgi:hypothetical protein